MAVAVLLGTHVVALGCVAAHQSSDVVTKATLQRLHAALLAYQTTHGVVPESLSAVCRHDSRLCLRQPVEGWRRDAWGRPITYLVRGRDFELISGGMDGNLGTGDDLALSSVAEARVVQKFTGCYRMELAWWRAFDHTIVVLDSVVSGLNYRLSPDVGHYQGGWNSHGADSVELRWIDAHTSVTLVLGQRGDSLFGRAVEKNRRVTAVRARCP